MRDDGIDEGLEKDRSPRGAPEEPPPAGSPLSRRQLDELVDQVVTEELARLNGAKGKP